MESAIKKYRDAHGMTFDAIAKAAGISWRSIVFKHANGAKISPESALRYHRALGIPLSDLRPDLWPPDAEERTTEPTQEEKTDGHE